MTEDLKSASCKRQRRRRPTKSCEPCRARKVKCDRGLPCKPCLRSRASLLCTYKSEHLPTSSRSPNDSLSPQPDTVQEAGVLSDTPEASQSGNALGSLDHPHTSRAHDEATARISYQISTYEDACQISEDQLRKNSDLRDLETRLSKVEQCLVGSSSESRPSDKSELQIKLPRPHLRAEHEKTRLFGKTHWIHSLDQFKILSQMQSKPYSVAEGAQAEANGIMLEAASARRRAKTHGAKLLQEPMPTLRESIPPKAICDQAIDGYLRTFEPMFRVLHVPSFMREYESFWTQAEPVQTEFLMKLTMVITVGAIFFADRSASNEIKRTARNWIYAVQWWLIGPTERDAMNLHGIQVFCLLLLARQVNSLGGTASIATEALLKLSFTLGLHIDPRFHSSVTPFESELRRRLWLTVLELTTITALNSTLPLLISMDDYHVPLPSNIADSKLGDNDDSETRQESTKHEGLNCSLQIIVAKSLRLRIQIVRELNGTGREASYEKTIALANSLQTHCREMAAFFQQDKVEGQNMTTMGFHQKFLDTYFRRLVLFLHRPFAHQARKDHRFFMSRKICLESSLIMASHTENMKLPTVSLDDFSSCCISGSGMFKGALGQDIILSISLEVITQLEEEGLGDSRYPRTGVADPLVLLARTQRKPMMQYLMHVRDQWRQILLLGRPSLKSYLFVSCIISQIEAMESGQDVKASILDTIKRGLRECTGLLQDSPAYGNVFDAMSEWTDDTSPYAIDTMALFGFDFSTLDPTLLIDIPDWTDTPNTMEVQNLM
ncbi:hypothetical protein HD806DRAFT_525894 [Xylariaceae sp. AK1471]|nr:hypothetical protein HD806DRAFT_525894 [Xylariaceae sp. AK1471]